MFVHVNYKQNMYQKYKQITLQRDAAYNNRLNVNQQSERQILFFDKV